MSKSILNVDFIEVRYHILGLVLRVVNLFYSVKNYSEDYLMRHYSCIVQKVAIALLYSFDSGLEHMFGLAVNTYANG